MPENAGYNVCVDSSCIRRKKSVFENTRLRVDRVSVNMYSLYLYTPQDGTKVFTASADKTCKMWDLNSNQAIAIAQVQVLALIKKII